MKKSSYKEGSYNQSMVATLSRVSPLDERGLTLVELLVVVAIIGILATIAISAYGKFIEKSKISVALATSDAIKKAVLILEADTGLWPGAETSDQCKSVGNEFPDLTAANVGLFDGSPAFPGWDGPYLDPSQLDDSGKFTDPWGMSYFLDCDYKINTVDYAVTGSFGPNKVGINVYDSDDAYVVIGNRN